MTGALQLELGPPDRLADLGLDVETLHRAVRAGIEARAIRTAFAPRNAQGTDLVSTRSRSCACCWSPPAGARSGPAARSGPSPRKR